MSVLEFKIKEEFEEKFNDQCRTCLSIGRKMVPVGEYLNIFRCFMWEYEFDASKFTKQLKLCWECYALLKKIQKFQLQVQKANEILRLGQSELCSLSRLTTVITNSNESNAVYVFDQTFGKEEEKSSVCKVNEESAENCVKTHNCKDIKYITNKNKCNDKEISDKKAKKRRSKKWAMERALLNKEKKFKFVTDIERHIDMIFSKRKLDQVQMQRFFSSERESNDYVSKTFKCNNCVFGFNKEEMLTEHVKKCHEENVGAYVCDICSRRLPDKNKLTSHVQSHYVIYKCNVCNFVCRKKNCRLKHAERHRTVLQCLTCELLFGNRQEFFKHHKDWHQQFVCDKCGISFKMKYCIEDHIRKQHSPYECKQCSKQFSRYNGLWLHNKVKHTTSPAAYCVECDRQYPDRYRYGWHLTNSVRHRPREKLRIPCPECDKVFSKNIYMKEHYNLVHLKNFKYRCEECDKNFIRNADLRKHNRRVHEGILPPKDKICYVCGRGFTTNKILANHLRTHTGERPFACARCPSRFAQSAALASHIRSLHGT